MTKLQNILGLNTEFDSLNYIGFDEWKFSAARSFFDYDAIVINANHIVLNYELSPLSPYENKRLLSESASRQIKEDFKKIKEQIIAFLKQGKNIFILVGKNENCFIYTRKREYSGTGRNMKTTNLVTPFDMYSFLPIEFRTTEVFGENVQINNVKPYKEFFKNTKEHYWYSAYFECDEATSLLEIEGIHKSVAAEYPYENGKIIFLPTPYVEDDYEDEEEWMQNGKEYLDELFSLNEKLSFDVKGYELPVWANDFFIKNEKAVLEQLDSEKKNLELLKLKIEQIEDNVKDIQQYKSAFTATGESLEQIIKKILKELNFELFDAPKGRSDIIASYKGRPIVAEIKGVGKSAAEKHAAQLEKWASQYIEENDNISKPLLIINGFCDTPLDKRNEDVFPDQMQKYCIARGHALITTIQLLCLYLEVKENPILADERINELLDTIGKYERYSNVFDFIKRIDSLKA